MGLFPIQEKVLSTKERNKLQDEYFGIPELKKYPMPDKNHVLSAMRYFNKCPKGYEKILAKNIIKKAKEFDIGINKSSDYYKVANENTIINEGSSNRSKKLYFLSTTSMDNTILQPRIPDNYLVKNGYEDNKTKRVCFAPSIDKWLMGLYRNLKGEKLCVHVAIDYGNLKMKTLTEHLR